MYIDYYDREVRQKDDNPTVGLILCEDKKEAVVRYTLSKDNKQIFASRYKLYLPSEEELLSELCRDRYLPEKPKRQVKTVPRQEERGGENSHKGETWNITSRWELKGSSTVEVKDGGLDLRSR